MRRKYLREVGQNRLIAEERKSIEENPQGHYM